MRNPTAKVEHEATTSKLSEDQLFYCRQRGLSDPGCPVACILPGQVESAIRAVAGVSEACLELVWDPPWSQDCMSDEAKLTLGLF